MKNWPAESTIGIAGSFGRVGVNERGKPDFSNASNVLASSHLCAKLHYPCAMRVIMLCARC